MIEEVENWCLNSLGIEEKENRGAIEVGGYHKAVQSMSPKFVNKILAVFAASVAGKPPIFQRCAAAQHKSSTAMNERPPAHTLDQWKTLRIILTKSLQQIPSRGRCRPQMLPHSLVTF